MRTNNDDCEILISGIEDVFDDLGSCFSNAVDKNKSKASVVKSLFNFGGSLTKLAFNTTSCAIKNAPKAVVAVAAVKREVIGVIEDEIHEYQKQQKIDALDEKIKQIQLKTRR